MLSYKIILVEKRNFTAFKTFKLTTHVLSNLIEEKMDVNNDFYL